MGALRPSGAEGVGDLSKSWCSRGWGTRLASPTLHQHPGSTCPFPAHQAPGWLQDHRALLTSTLSSDGHFPPWGGSGGSQLPPFPLGLVFWHQGPQHPSCCPRGISPRSTRNLHNTCQHHLPWWGSGLRWEMRGRPPTAPEAATPSAVTCQSCRGKRSWHLERSPEVNVSG